MCLTCYLSALINGYASYRIYGGSIPRWARYRAHLQELILLRFGRPFTWLDRVNSLHDSVAFRPLSDLIEDGLSHEISAWMLTQLICSVKNSQMPVLLAKQGSMYLF